LVLPLQAGASWLGGASLGDFDEAAAAELRGYWSELAPRICHIDDVGTREQIQLALRVAYQAHQGQKRKSGEPFIIHPVKVRPPPSVSPPTCSLLSQPVRRPDINFPLY
jgi:hypothetical protein